MRGRTAREIELEGQLALAKVLARRLYRSLSVRVGIAVDVLFEREADAESLRIVNVAFDAAQIVWERHRVLVEPCRRIMDAPIDGALGGNYPGQGEMYVGTYPDGSTRNLTRAQLLMMAGMDPDQDGAA